MTTSSTTFRRALLLLLAFVATPLWASKVLTFDVTSHTEAAKGAKQTVGTSPAEEHYTMTVTLAADTLQVDRPDQLTVYDFARRRMLRVDKPKHSYVEGSLYSRIGFDVAEFGNRMMLAKVLATLKQANNPMAPALTEHLMALSDPVNATVIDTRTVGTDTVYSWAKQPLMTVSQKTRDVPAATLGQYLRFLRYEVGGHPKILSAIERGGGVPERLTIVRSNMSVETRTLTLQGIDERADAPFSPEGYTRAMPEREPFTTLKLLSSTPAADLNTRTTALRGERDAALAAGHVFDATLANFIIGLSTGEQDEGAAWLRSHIDQINAEQNMGRLMQSLEPHDEASARQAAETLAALKQVDNPHGYVLNIFEANVRASLKDEAQAEKLYFSALSVNPTITGAWIDLGNQYYRRFDAEAAWACWDAARALNPAHPFLKSIDTMEQKLRVDHPEFF